MAKKYIADMQAVSKIPPNKLAISRYRVYIYFYIKIPLLGIT
jgi:hypothetical protein